MKFVASALVASACALTNLTTQIAVDSETCAAFVQQFNQENAAELSQSLIEAASETDGAYKAALVDFNNCVTMEDLIFEGCTERLTNNCLAAESSADEKKPEDEKPEDEKPEDEKPEDEKPEDEKPEDNTLYYIIGAAALVVIAAGVAFCAKKGKKPEDELAENLNA